MPGRLTQRGGRAGTCEVGAEFLRLHHSSLGEVAARDPGREAKVVLDTRAASCLAPDGDHLEDQGAQSLRGAIDRCRQTGWPCTDDDEVKTALGQAVEGQAEVLRQHSRRWVAQDRTGDDHDRQFVRFDGELAQEAFDGRVAVGIKPLVGDAVAGQELPHPERLGRETGTHDANGGSGATQQKRPAGEKGGEDGVAQTGVRRDYVLQRHPRHHKDLARLNDAGRQIHPLTR